MLIKDMPAGIYAVAATGSFIKVTKDGIGYAGGVKDSCNPYHDWKVGSHNHWGLNDSRFFTLVKHLKRNMENK